MIQKTLPGKTQRLGFTLTELVMVVTVAGLIGTLSVRVIHALSRQQTTANVQLFMQASTARMRDRFIRDVNLAVTADVTRQAVELALPETVKITWQRDGATIVRTSNDNGDIRNDHFDILAEQECSFASSSVADGKQLIAMEFKPNNAALRDNRYVTSSQSTLISAELARDHRWDEHRELEQ